MTNDLIVVDPVLLPPAPPSTSQLMAAIDDAVAAVLDRSTRFSMGYEQREAAALAFKNAGYTGDPTVWISRFAQNTGRTNKDSADLVLAQAAMLRQALLQLEALRMDKYLIAAAATPHAALDAYNQIVAAVAQIAKQL